MKSTIKKAAKAIGIEQPEWLLQYRRKRILAKREAAKQATEAHEFAQGVKPVLETKSLDELSDAAFAPKASAKESASTDSGAKQISSRSFKLGPTPAALNPKAAPVPAKLKSASSTTEQSPQGKTTEDFADMRVFGRKNQTARLVVVTAFHGRHKMVEFATKFAKKAYPVTTGVSLVGSGDEDEAFGKALAKQKGVLYSSHENKPLGRKWLAAVHQATLFDPDYIMISGSDDLVSSKFVEKAIAMMENEANENFYLFAPRQWHIYNCGASSTNSTSVMEASYTRSKRWATIGAGRIYRRSFLDAVDWNIFDPEKSILLDDLAPTLMERHNIFYANAHHGSVLSVKGNWAAMNDYDKVLEASQLQWRIFDPATKRAYWKEQFPFSEADLISALS